MVSILQKFSKNNPKVIIEKNGKETIIKNLWNDDSFMIKYENSEKIPNISELFLYEELVGIFDKKNKKVEFIYTVLDNKEIEDLKNKKFLFNYKGTQYKCYYAPSSKYLEFFGKFFTPLKSESTSNYRQLWRFKEYYSGDKKFLEPFFKGKAPYSFYIDGFNFGPKQRDEMICFLKTLNFYLSYYERQSPNILIYEDDDKKNDIKIPCYSEGNKFPSIINGTEIDRTLIDVINVARETQNIRQKFIFYYQIIEYIAYYFLSDDIKLKLKKILSNPEIGYKPDDFVKEILELIPSNPKEKDLSFERFKKVIKFYCEIKDIYLELDINKNFFKEDVKFKGGLVLDRLSSDVSKIKDEESFEKILSNIWKIRNVLVHLREVREDKVILPTKNNDELIKPYLYIIRRLSEKMIIQFNII